MSLLDRLPPAAVDRLIRNFEANRVANAAGQPEIDHRPVVKLLVPTARAVWLLTEYNAAHGVFFGLCDLGHGFPEIGYVALQDLDSLTGPLGSIVDYDMTFAATKTLSAYADDAHIVGYVTA